MNEQDNKSSAEQQAESIIQDALKRNDYLALYNLAERVMVTIYALKGYQRTGLLNLTGVDLNSLAFEIGDVLRHVESPYSSDDLDDTQPPKEAA